jgi:6-phosphogluconolactonase
MPDHPHRRDDAFVYVGKDDDEIAIFRLDRETGALTRQGGAPAGRHPSFLAFAPSKKFAYAVNEFSNEVASFAVDRASGALTLLNRVSSLGAEPAYVTVDRTGKWVLAANYRSGPVAVYPVEPDGSLGAPSDAKTTGVHPHAVVLDRSNRFAFVPNLGSNTVSQLLFDDTRGKLADNEPGGVSTPAGSEPRHFALHPSGAFAYLIEEAGCRIDAFAVDAAKGTLSLLGSMATLPRAAAAGVDTGSDLHVSPSGKFLYGSNRGHDSIVICSIDARGMPAMVGHESTRGKTPRNFGLDPTGTFLLAANQGSGTIVVFRIDAERGTLRHLTTTDVGAAPYWVGAVTFSDA